MKKVAILTAGGDCPGLNAVIRGITKTCIEKYGIEVYGVKKGYRGLVDDNLVQLTIDDVEEILDKGDSTVLHWLLTFKYNSVEGKENKEFSELLKNYIDTIKTPKSNEEQPKMEVIYDLTGYVNRND